MIARTSASKIGDGNVFSGPLPLVYASFVAVLLQVVTLGLAASPVSATDRQQDSVCYGATKYLPRTPDAVEGWLRDCPSR
jgi:hypothetical protein